jgi:hypothetical protein
LEPPSSVFPKGGSGEGIYKHPAGMNCVNWAGISVDCEHETRMEHIASASATHPVTQVGDIANIRNIEKKDQILM